MDAYDCEQINKAMSLKLNAIYKDPKRHAFVPEGGYVGRRGGYKPGRKTFCDHCGKKRKGHAEKTEQV